MGRRRLFFLFLRCREDDSSTSYCNMNAKLKQIVLQHMSYEGGQQDHTNPQSSVRPSTVEAWLCDWVRAFPLCFYYNRWGPAVTQLTVLYSTRC